MRNTPQTLTRVPRKIAIAAGFLLALLACSAPPSGALGSITVTPSPVPMTSDQTQATVTVDWTGQKPNVPIFIKICSRSISDPNFNGNIDCSILSEVAAPGSANGNGTYQFDVFRGVEPSGDYNWGCFAPGDTVPSGIANRGCWVYVTNNTSGNVTDAAESQLQFSVSGGAIPEAPIGVLLPVSAAVVAAGGFLFLRQRQRAGQAA